jgi:hypothetical protein
VKLNRRTVGLAIVAAVVVAAAVAATFVGHKSSGESRQRKAVSDYIDTVNLIQNQMHIQLTRVSFAYRDLATHSGRRKLAPRELGAAATTLTRLDRRLVATPAPPEAKKLRALLVRLVAQQASLTREVQQLATFTPRFSVFLDRLRTASTRFDTAMRSIPKPTLKTVRGTKAQAAAAVREYRAQQDAAAAAQARAIDTYVAGVTELVTGLRKLTAPAVVAPAYDAEVRALHDVAAAGKRLSAELRTADRTHAADRIRTFTLAGREAGTLAVQRAQIAAIRAYNRRSHAIGTSSSAVQAELTRLSRELP